MDGYLFDPHTHTAETSKCGHLPAAEVVDRYVRHGFSGLVVMTISTRSTSPGLTQTTIGIRS